MTSLPARAAVLSIAGLEFRISCAGCLLEDDPEPEYRPFLRAEPTPGAGPVVAVTVRRGPAPAGERLETVFDTGDTWLLRRDRPRGQLRLLLPRPGHAVPEWEAVLGGEEAAVWCVPSAPDPGDPAARVENPLRYPLDQLLVAHYLDGHGVILHAGGAVRGGRAVAFAGPSSAGKTTLARLIAAHGGFSLLSDDRVVARRSAAGFALWGTPWPGEGGYALNESAPLAAVCFLRQDGRTAVRPLAARQALARLVPVVSLPWYERDALAAPLALCGELLARVPAYELVFTPTADAPAALADLLAA